MEKKSEIVKLNWSRLLGFDQASTDGATLNAPQLSRLGAKIGGKAAGSKPVKA